MESRNGLFVKKEQAAADTRCSICGEVIPHGADHHVTSRNKWFLTSSHICSDQCLKTEEKDLAAATAMLHGFIYFAGLFCTAYMLFALNIRFSDQCSANLTCNQLTWLDFVMFGFILLAAALAITRWQQRAMSTVK